MQFPHPGFNLIYNELFSTESDTGDESNYSINSESMNDVTENSDSSDTEMENRHSSSAKSQVSKVGRKAKTKLPMIKMDPDSGLEHSYNTGENKTVSQVKTEAEAWSSLPRFFDSLEDMLLYQCGICRKRVERLTDHLDQEHELTIREYSAIHPGPAMDTSLMQHR